MISKLSDFFAKIYLWTFSSRPDVYIIIDVTMETALWQQRLPNCLLITLEDYCRFISSFTYWVIISHLIQHYFIKFIITINVTQAFYNQIAEIADTNFSFQQCSFLLEFHNLQVIFASFLLQLPGFIWV